MMTLFSSANFRMRSRMIRAVVMSRPESGSSRSRRSGSWRSAAEMRTFLPHALRIRCDRPVHVLLEVENAEERPDPVPERRFVEPPEPADHDEVVVGAQVGVDLRLLGDISQAAFIGVKVGADLPAFEKDLPFRRFEEAGEHLDRGRLAGPVGPEISQHLARADNEADVFDDREGRKLLGDPLEFQHGPVPYSCNLHAIQAWNDNMRRDR